ncbi:hypothetical protein TSUD_367390 [Trifolium subterraneum]|uniref:Uncharacterized protein n=1 Tax=Trifolium subterraneum TaxID=3900 RepID=A0A2Z6NAW8_TRISU|nr:hypothetical protein TSUD_367390 [Trifolium subterraneum]
MLPTGITYSSEDYISNIVLYISSNDDNNILPKETSHQKGSSSNKKKKTTPTYMKLNVKSVILDSTNTKLSIRFGS